MSVTTNTTTNTIVVQNANQTITVVDNESTNTNSVNITQPLVNVIEVASPGPQGPVGPQGVAGPSEPFANIGNGVYATTSSLQVTGSFLVSGSSTFTNIGPAIFSGSVNATGGVTMSSALVSGNVTVLGTASIGTLVVNQTVLSTGSNQLGDSANDTQTLYGTVRIPTGSLTVSGNVLFGTSSAGFYWDNTNGYLGIKKTNPAVEIDVVGSIRASSIMFNTTTQTTIIQVNSGVSTLRFLSGSVETARYDGNNWGFYTATPTARLQVKGSGATSSTISLRVENTNASASLVVLDNGFVGINTGSAQYNLDVNGTARANSIFFGAGLPSVLSVDPTTALTNSTTAGTSVRIGDNVGSTITGYQTYVTSPGIADRQYTSGEGGVMMLGSTLGFNRTFSPTSGTGVYNILRLSSTINQTGGANGITRGLYINPTLTSAANFRAIETTAGNVLFGGTGSVTISNVLTLTPQSPLPSGVATGSFAVSSSVPPKPYFYDGTTWNALY